MVKETSEIKESTWQGNTGSHRLNDSSLELQECFSWSTKWRSAPTYTICGINEIVQQLARTLVRDQRMGKTASTSCRLCNQRSETVEHILSGCPELAQRLYLWRHNDVLKHVLSVLLMKHGLRNKPLSQNQEPKSYYTNQDRCVWDYVGLQRYDGNESTGWRKPAGLADHWPRGKKDRHSGDGLPELAKPSWNLRKKDQEVPNSERWDEREIPRIRRESDKHHSRYSGRIW